MSSVTNPAPEHDHKYQLTLSDYAEVALWMQNYGKGW
jgi:hypothetical protein